MYKRSLVYLSPSYLEVRDGSRSAWDALFILKNLTIPNTLCSTSAISNIRALFCEQQQVSSNQKKEICKQEQISFRETHRTSKAYRKMLDRKYIVFRSYNNFEDYHCELTSSDPYEDKRIKIFDHKLHQTLSEIFRRNRFTRDQVKELSCSPGHAVLGDIFPKNNELSLLWITVLFCFENTAELLVRSGADVNELYEPEYHTHSELVEKSNILHALVLMYPSSWNERFISLVLELSVDLLKARDYRGRTALHLAARGGRVQTAKLLLEKGADINVTEYDWGNTPLLEAARTFEAGELLPLLMKHGADITFTNKIRWNVLAYLSGAPGEHVNLARDLIEKGALLGTDGTSVWPHQPILRATFRGNNEFVNLFLDYGENANARSRNGGGIFPLHSAASCDNPAVLQTLLKRGANIDMKTTTARETALHNACNSAKEENVKVLLSAGADMFAEDNRGKTPYARIDRAYVEDPIVQLMLKTLALRKACLQPTIESELEKPFNTRFPRNCVYYQTCKAFISRTKSTRFIESCNFFELLTKCQCQIARLMGNNEFEAKFKLYDLSPFCMYADDIREAFERAQHYHQYVLEQEDIINQAFYYVLPHVVVRKVLPLLLICEECEMKKIVQASRWQ